MKQAKLNVPTNTKGNDQLTVMDVEETHNIANVRIHIERVIGTVQKGTVY